MRILVLATTFPRRAEDSTPRFVLDLAAELARRGHQLTVVAPHAAGAARRERLEGVDVVRVRYFLPENRQVLAYGGGILGNVRHNPLALVQAPSFAARVLLGALMQVRRWRPDVLHSHWVIPTGIAGAFAGGSMQVPHVATMHAADVVALEKLPLRSHLAGFVVRRTAHHLPVSHSIKERFAATLQPGERARFALSSTVQPMGVDVPGVRAELPAELERDTVLFIGRFVEKKGIPVLLEAMQQVWKTHVRAHLVLCGTGPLEKEIHERVNLDGHAKLVQMRGHVPEAEKRALLGARPILVLPSVVASFGDVEGLPVVLLEGLAAGCPIVASRTGGIPEVIEDGVTGLLVPPGDSASLARAIGRLLDEEALRRRMSAKAMRRAENYAWPKVAAVYEARFNSAQT